MANPQPTDPTLRIAHKIAEQIMVSGFTEQQRRILDLILRLSWGCGKKYAIIPRQQDFEVVGVSKTHIRQHLDFLMLAGVITRSGTHYAFNKDYDQWRISRALGYQPEKLSALISLNLAPEDDLLGSEVPENGTFSHNNQMTTSDFKKKFRKTEQKSSGKRNISTPELAVSIASIIDNNNNNTGMDTVIKKGRRLFGEIPEDVLPVILGSDIEMVEQAVAETERMPESKRNWKYLAGMLRNWKAAGKPGKAGRPVDDPDRFIRGKYGPLVER